MNLTDGAVEKIKDAINRPDVRVMVNPGGGERVSGPIDMIGLLWR